METSGAGPWASPPHQTAPCWFRMTGLGQYGGSVTKGGSKRTLTMSAKIGVCGLKIALAFTLHPAFAQVTAAVSGTIEDASGGALGGVTVSVKSVETGISRVTTTGENGAFRVLSLPVGPLELSGEKQGFRTVRTG